MKATYKVLAIGTFSVLSAFGAITASAQGVVNSEPLGQSTAANGGTAASLPDVDAGALAVTHPTSNGEPLGQSTAAPMTNGSVSREQVQREAIAAMHPATNSEPIGQSTSPPMSTGSGTASGE
jgi:hypothetical protein